MAQNTEHTGVVDEDVAREAEEAVSREASMNYRLRQAARTLNRQLQEVEKRMPSGRQARTWMRRNQQWTVAGALGVGVLAGYGLAAWLYTPPPTFRQRVERGAQKLATQARAQAAQTSQSAVRSVDRASKRIRRRVEERREIADAIGNLAGMAASSIALRTLSRWARRD